MRITSVRVQRGQVDDATFTRCFAHLYHDSELVISSMDNGAVIRTFPADQWERCSVLGADGAVDFSFANDRLLRGEEMDAVRR